MVVDLNLKERYPAFLQHYDAPEDFVGVIPDLIKENQEAHADMNKVLKLGEDGRVLLEIPEDSAKSYPEAHAQYLSTVAAAYGATDLAEDLLTYDCLVKNQGRDGQKLSKHLLKLARKDESKLPLLPNLKASHGARGWCRETTTRWTMDTLPRVIQDFFSALAPTQYKLYLSTNFWDILNCSNASATRSCFRPDSCSPTAPVSMALSSRVALLYSTPSNILHASSRAWIVFSEDYTEYQLLRTYGSWPTGYKEGLTKYIETTLAETKGYTGPFLYQKQREQSLGTAMSWALRLVNKAGNVYNDTITTLFAYNPTAGGTVAGFLPKYAEPKCLGCGTSEFKFGFTLLCPKCRKKLQTKKAEKVGRSRCHMCGVYCTSVTGEGAHICSTCIVATGRHKCSVCNRYHRTAEGAAACPHEDVRSCVFCGKDHLVSSGTTVCPECVTKAQATTCPVCGKFKPHEVINFRGNVRCFDCLEAEQKGTTTDNEYRSLFLKASYFPGAFLKQLAKSAGIRAKGAGEELIPINLREARKAVLAQKEEQDALRFRKLDKQASREFRRAVAA